MKKFFVLFLALVMGIGLTVAMPFHPPGDFTPAMELTETAAVEAVAVPSEVLAGEVVWAVLPGSVGSRPIYYSTVPAGLDDGGGGGLPLSAGCQVTSYEAAETSRSGSLASHYLLL